MLYRVANISPPLAVNDWAFWGRSFHTLNHVTSFKRTCCLVECSEQVVLEHAKNVSFFKKRKFRINKKINDDVKETHTWTLYCFQLDIIKNYYLSCTAFFIVVVRCAGDVFLAATKPMIYGYREKNVNYSSIFWLHILTDSYTVYWESVRYAAIFCNKFHPMFECLLQIVPSDPSYYPIIWL